MAAPVAPIAAVFPVMLAPTGSREAPVTGSVLVVETAAAAAAAPQVQLMVPT
jgi:hypothetical protein